MLVNWTKGEEIVFNELHLFVIENGVCDFKSYDSTLEMSVKILNFSLDQLFFCQLWAFFEQRCLS